MEFNEGDIVEIYPLRYRYQRDTLRGSTSTYTSYKIVINGIDQKEIEKGNLVKGVYITSINKLISVIKTKYDFNGEITKKEPQSINLGFRESRYL